MRKTTILFTVFLMAITPINAENIISKKLAPSSLTGRVVDENGYVLPGATIIIEGTNIGAVSDVNGFFRVNGLKKGTYQVKIKYIGYIPEKRIVTIENKTIALNNIVLKEGILMDEIVVTGLSAEKKALQKQKTDINITNVISADQVSRFPDSNIGDALKRIPGISVQYDQGEARFGHIRGTSPDLSSVTIDGARIPSAEAEMRSVQLDLIPSDMIQTIEVNKVVTPDMEADAIGGSINLVTKSQPAMRRITAMAGSGWNMISEKPTWNLGFSYANRYLNNKLGMVFAMSYQNNPLGSDNAEFEWEKDKNGEIYVEDYQVRQYFVERDRQSYSFALDYVFNPDHKIEFSSMYNKRRDWENRYRFRLKKIKPDGNGFEAKEAIRQLKFGVKDNKYGRLEDQRVIDFSLKGEHHFGKASAKWKVNYAKASEERPNERYLSYLTKKVKFKNNLSDLRKPMASEFSVDVNNLKNLKFDELTEEYQFTKDEDIAGKIDFKIRFNTSGKWKNSLRFGGGLKSKSKSNNEDLMEYEPKDSDAFDTLVRENLKNMTRDNFLAGNYKVGDFPSKEYFGDIQLKDNNTFKSKKNLESDLADFDATEKIYNGYIRFDQRIQKNVNLIAGMRMEHTASRYNAFAWDPEKKAPRRIQSDKDRTYTNILPSLIAKWDATKDFKLKAAWTNTIARPKYIDLTPRIVIDKKGIELGNPDLKATKSMNFDLMAEFYNNGNGLFSAGVYYKSIKDFIVDERLRDKEVIGIVWDKYKRPINAGDADLLGFEVSAQQKLYFLPGFMCNFNVYGNYTYNYSKVKNFNYEDRENDQLCLPGTPKHTLNMALGYETKKFSARLSYNYASDFIDKLGKAAFFDRYYDAVNYLDFNANAKIGKHVNIFANINNILNQPLRYYQGSKDYTMQMEYYSFRFDAGVKLIF